MMASRRCSTLLPLLPQSEGDTSLPSQVRCEGGSSRQSLLGRRTTLVYSWHTCNTSTCSQVCLHKGWCAGMWVVRCLYSDLWRA
jgi:hypothetical protein